MHARGRAGRTALRLACHDTLPLQRIVNARGEEEGRPWVATRRIVLHDFGRHVWADTLERTNRTLRTCGEQTLIADGVLYLAGRVPSAIYLDTGRDVCPKATRCKGGAAAASHSCYAAAAAGFD